MDRQQRKATKPRPNGRAIAGAIGIALMAPALAMAQGWYIGAGAGQSKLKDSDQALLGTSTDDQDTGWKAFAGYEFTPYVAGELGYADFGKFTGSGPGVSDEWKANAFDLSLVGRLPLPQKFALIGKVGAAHWNVDENFTALGVSASPSENGTDVKYGVGAEYDFTRNIGGRLEWERYKNAGDENTTGKSDLDLLSLNVMYKFR